MGVGAASVGAGVGAAVVVAGAGAGVAAAPVGAGVGAAVVGAVVGVSVADVVVLTIAGVVGIRVADDAVVDATVGTGVEETDPASGAWGSGSNIIGGLVPGTSVWSFGLKIIPIQQAKLPGVLIQSTSGGQTPAAHSSTSSSHSSPRQPGLQRQKNSPGWAPCVHVPPLLHGLHSHSLMSSSQKLPLKPTGHAHWTALSGPMEQEAPF